ncbi:MAG: hypothetical protein Tsb002_38200 [Wenzhouxiangellaceae bacterium]
MLIITRHCDQSFIIDLAPGCPQTVTAEQLFRNGPIRVSVIRNNQRGVRLAIDAPPELRILRSELLHRPHAKTPNDQ